ncbi:MAG TPA: DUF1552 domain-containing protein [Bdellovibrionales bacterium]|nr:DUF1552 domain-containing protein [Bdellovibrionales bacterium]
MNRREFVFRSLQASLLLSPVLSIRRAEAQQLPRMKVLFWVCCSGYPDAEAFFPTGDEFNWNLSPILQHLGGIKDQMIVIDNLNIRPTGPNPNGAEHARSVGKILTAKDLLPVSEGVDDEGDLGGISIETYVGRELNVRSICMMVEDRYRRELRSHPFATGPRQTIRPFFEPDEAWDNTFRDFIPPDSNPGLPEFEARMRRLRGKKSILDGMLGELSRFRRELVGIERLKLDVHEDAIRRTEEGIRRDLEEEPPRPRAECRVPDRVRSSSYVPERCQLQQDLLFASFACERVQSAGHMWGSSGYHWNYGWLPNFGVIDSIHNIVHHDPAERERYIRSSAWDWQQIGRFAERLRNTPDGSGNMLDNTLIVALSLFGRHHEINRIPAVVFGNAQGRLRTNRFVRAPFNTYHDKLLTSAAKMMGVNTNGFGDDMNCGPLEQLP